MAERKRKGAAPANAAGLPLRAGPPPHTVELREMLGDLQDAPQVLGLEGVDPAAVEIGLAVRAARLNKGLTQSELARRTGLTQGAISNIERGVGPEGPSIRVLRDLATALDAKIGLIQSGEEKRAAVPATAKETLCVPQAQEPGRIVRAGAGGSHLDLVGAVADAATCLPFLQLALPQFAIAHLIRAVRELARSRTRFAGAEEAPVFNFWRLHPLAHSQLTVKAPTVALAYQGLGRVEAHGRWDLPEFGRLTIAEVDQTIDLRNEGEEALSVMTMVIYPSVAESLEAL